TFAVTINDVNEFAVSAPVDTNGAANAVNENAANGTAVGITAHATDDDATNNTVSRSVARRVGRKFSIDAGTGEVAVAGAIDRETDGPSLSITVRATSTDGSHADTTFAVTINDVNEFAVSAPVDTNGAANAVNENAANGTAVGITAHATDDDATNNTVS